MAWDFVLARSEDRFCLGVFVVPDQIDRVHRLLFKNQTLHHQTALLSTLSARLLVVQLFNLFTSGGEKSSG
jgi:hypothetical protein